MIRAGVWGKNISYTMSPKIFSELSKITGEPCLYNAYDKNMDALTITELVNKKVTGWNVTIPFKSAVLDFCQDKGFDALVTGAANTISVKDGKLRADNTDIYGVQKVLETLDLKNKKILMLGAGGAARAAIVALSRLGVSEIALVNRSVERAESLIHDLSTAVSTKLYFVADVEKLDHKFEGLIHARPYCGENIEPLLNHIDTFIFDMVYRSSPTQLETLAHLHSLKFFDGLSMLVWQAMRSWDLWLSDESKSISQNREVFEKIYLSLGDRL